MSKLFGKILKNSSVLALVAAPAVAFAAPSTGPISIFGIQGSYSDFKLQGGSQSEKDYAPEGGVFFNFGNKLTAESGFIYQAGVEANYGENSGSKLKEAQADLDLGWRAALDSRNFVDVLAGGGYTWSRYERDPGDYDAKLTGKSPFAKAAVGYNHQFDDMTMRVELGARHTINGRATLKVDGVGSDTMDLKDRTNPYAEVSLLMNQKGELPVMAGLYYTRTEYKLDGDSYVADKTKLTRNEYGLKVGVAF